MTAASMIRNIGITALVLLLAAGAWTSAEEVCDAQQLFRIEVVERGTDWPVPLVELRTTNNLRFVSDNAGLIAIDAPELFGREVWFEINGHGYEVSRDGFGSRGVRATPSPGKSLRIEVDRKIIARRIGRLTGGGIYGESQRLGEAQDWKESGVFGCDSTQTAIHRGRKYWIWGDTTLPKYPLGIFHSTCATTAVNASIALDPPLRISFDYLRNDKGEPRTVAKLPGKGPTWLTALTSLNDQMGTPHLVATYMKIDAPLEAYEQGLAHWDELKQAFERLRVVWSKAEGDKKPPPIPDGHSAHWTDSAGKVWVLFGNPLPTLRVPATFEAWQDPRTWEALKPQESLPSADGKHAIKPHSGAIAWHPWRARWVTVFVESFGSPSAFGEVWYAEAKQPTGPWGPAVKILSHENYTFYNPCIHPQFSPQGSPFLYFEGTFTNQFTDHAPATPRYEYNQILYRLDLDDPALAKARGE